MRRLPRYSPSNPFIAYPWHFPRNRTYKDAGQVKRTASKNYCGYPLGVPNRIPRTFNALTETRKHEEPVGWGATHATAGGMIGAAKV
ncbi:MAG: hypothetical protein [Olavius algarvensis Gamma 1 endosymbiont]|nr:MAG: hypothetical protein [Olavius algarvensis Gamma 1 endosymbiont]